MTKADKSILVTGAGGFLGHHMANYLASSGYEVIGMDVHFPAVAVDGQPRLFTVIEEDFRNWEITRKLLAKSSAVYHFASAHLQISLEEKEYWDINVHSLRTLAEEVHKAGCERFNQIRTVGTYGKLAQVPANEETPCQPQSIYGETKLAGEKEVTAVCQKSGLPYVILRPAWIYGPGCPRTAKLARMLKKGSFIMIGKGANKRHPMYIKDMLTAFHKALTSEKALGATMIIGGGEIITTRELVDTFAKAMQFPRPKLSLPYPIAKLMAMTAETLFALIGKEPPVSRRTLEFFDTDNGFDISRSKSLLDFTPAYTFQQGMVDYAADNATTSP